MLGGENQDPLAKSTFVKKQLNDANPGAVIELTEAYEKFARSAQRGLQLIGNRRAVLVQDEFRMKEPCDVLWGLTTDADIDVKEGGVAELSLEGKRLIARILAPAGAGFAEESAEQEPPQRANEGVRRLVIRLVKAEGNVRIAVLLSPVWPEGGPVGSADVKPLEEW
jgi:hypothetical protein